MAESKKIVTRWYARVRPYDPKQGAVTRRITIRSKRFDYERGWYGPMTEDLAAELKAVKNRHRQPIFEVKSEQEAILIDEGQRSLRNAESVDEEKDLRPKKTSRKKPARPVLSPGESVIPSAEGMYEEEASAEPSDDPKPVKRGGRGRGRRSAEA